MVISEHRCISWYISYHDKMAPISWYENFMYHKSLVDYKSEVKGQGLSAKPHPNSHLKEGCHGQWIIVYLYPTEAIHQRNKVCCLIVTV